jgi:hypothetical protein
MDHGWQGASVGGQLPWSVGVPWQVGNSLFAVAGLTGCGGSAMGLSGWAMPVVGG